MNGDNNCHAQFSIPATAFEDGGMGDPPYETYDLSEMGRHFAECDLAGDYEGTMSVTIVLTGDVIEVPVSFHITTDGLVDVEEAFS